jgi:hypothetical protein
MERELSRRQHFSPHPCAHERSPLCTRTITAGSGQGPGSIAKCLYFTNN